MDIDPEALLDTIASLDTDPEQLRAACEALHLYLRWLSGGPHAGILPDSRHYGWVTFKVWERLGRLV